jgi:hypothetical protein
MYCTCVVVAYGCASTEAHLCRHWIASRVCMCSGEKTASVLRVVPALSLKDAKPLVLTRQPSGLLTAFTGRGDGCGPGGANDVVLFEPIAGKEVSYDMHVLARRVDVALAGRSGEQDDGFLEKREPKEAIIVVLDVSRSMLGLSGLGAAGDDDADDNDDDESDDEHDDEWWLRYAEQENEMSCMDIATVQARLQSLHEFTHAVSIVGRRSAGSKKEGANLVLCELAMQYKDSDARFARSLARHHTPLARWLSARHPSNNVSPLDDDVRAAPDHFLCPITRAVMHDPVVATDGHTYDRRAVEEWFERHPRSPLNGRQPAATNACHPSSSPPPDRRRAVCVATSQGRCSTRSRSCPTTTCARRFASGLSRRCRPHRP